MQFHERKIYLSNMEINKGQALLMTALEPNLTNLQKEIVPVTESLGRVTSQPVFAKISAPNYNAAAMDGILVKGEDTYAASERNPVQLKLNQDFVFIDTGEPVSEPYNSVIMVEDLVEIDENTVEIIKSAAPWQHIRPIGEDIVAHELILTANHQIRPMDLGALLSGGLVEVEVYQRPQVGLIPTGTEIIEPGEEVRIGSIIESNSQVFAALTIELGGVARRYSPVPDDYELLRRKIKEALEENDIVIINAGSSAGSEDYTVNLIAELGQVLVHGIATKPGKPTILGIIDGKPVFGIPGYPVSAYFVFETFVTPLIKALQSLRMPEKTHMPAIISKRIVSSLQHQEFVRVKLGQVEDKLIATPLNRGAGVTMSLVRADGVLVIPQQSEGVEAGEKVNIELLKPMAEIENTIVSIGSHDLLLDIISNLMQKANAEYFLSSAHVGSLGGIMALKRGEAHLAPVHLLDELNGEYNISFIQKYLGDREMSLIKGVKRIQGFIVKKGNPKDIQGFSDLIQENVQFVNRQRGAGTRILTDYQLKTLGIVPEGIKGYDREMTTHMAVAVAVSSGAADVGVGVFSAARALNLGFIPIGEESYDFAVPTKYLKEEKIQKFIQVLKSPVFEETLAELGGYRLEYTGEVLTIG